MPNFGIISKKYDLYNSADYDSYAEFIVKAFEQSEIPIKEVLDLGCGTGELSVRLADKSYSVTAADSSEDMLSVLLGKINGRDILPICQDMRELDLFGTVQGCICTFDCFNYLLTSEDLEKAIAKVGLFMEKGGIFVFDVNTDFMYTNVYDGKSYVYEEDGSMLIWRSTYNSKSRKCKLLLTSFEEDDGVYIRNDEVHIQKNHSRRTILQTLKKSGFEVIGVYGSTSFKPIEETDNIAYYAAKKIRSL